MADADSIFDPRAIARARALLAEPKRRPPSVLPALAAAAFFATSALGLAVAMVIAPPTVTSPMARPGAEP